MLRSKDPIDQFAAAGLIADSGRYDRFDHAAQGTEVVLADPFRQRQQPGPQQRLGIDHRLDRFEFSRVKFLAQRMVDSDLVDAVADHGSASAPAEWHADPGPDLQRLLELPGDEIVVRAKGWLGKDNPRGDPVSLVIELPRFGFGIK